MKLVLVAAVVALLATMVAAWGPATHYYFTSHGLTTPQTKETMSGTEMPDAFIFGGFVSGSNCTRFGELHDLMYAGYLVKQAIAEGNNSAHLNIALGFGAHVAGDYAGFFPGAYLTGHDANPKMTNWIAVWPLMTAVDAFVAQNIHSPQNETSYVPTLSKDDSEFMKRARDSYAKAAAAAGVSVVVPQVSANEIDYCANRWREVIQRETARSMAMPRSSYEWEMIYASAYNATTAAETQQQFRDAASCAILGISMWEEKILTPGMTPLQAMTDVEMFYVAQFKAGQCTPNTVKHDERRFPTAANRFRFV